MKTKDIIEDIIETLNDSQFTYPIYSAFDNEFETEPSGVVVVNVKELENLYHTGCNDYRVRVVIAGQTLSDEDKNRNIILDMFDTIKEKVENIDFAEQIENCAGSVIIGGNIESDGEINVFNFDVDLFICED